MPGGEALFRLHAAGPRTVRLLGSWDGWKQPGTSLEPVAPGWWQGSLMGLAPGEYEYKFVCDDQNWLADPANTARAADSYGGWNSVLIIPAP